MVLLKPPAPLLPQTVLHVANLVAHSSHGTARAAVGCIAKDAHCMELCTGTYRTHIGFSLYLLHLSLSSGDVQLYIYIICTITFA